MTREDIQLLLQDLCTRLPYGVIVSPIDCGKAKLIGFKDDHPILFDLVSQKEYDKPWEIEYIKPYLRPMSSMTEEEKEELLNHVLGGRSMEYFHITRDGSIDGNQEAEQDLYNLNLHWLDFGPLTTSSYIDWLNKNMFDYRGLIPKDLALSTEEFNPYI